MQKKHKNLFMLNLFPTNEGGGGREGVAQLCQRRKCREVSLHNDKFQKNYEKEEEIEFPSLY